MKGNARAPAQCWMRHAGAAQEALVPPGAPPGDEDPDVLDFESPEPDRFDLSGLDCFGLESVDLDSAGLASFAAASFEEESDPDPEDSVLWAFLRDSDG